MLFIQFPKNESFLNLVPTLTCHSHTSLLAADWKGTISSLFGDTSEQKALTVPTPKEHISKLRGLHLILGQYGVMEEKFWNSTGLSVTLLLEMHSTLLKFKVSREKTEWSTQFLFSLELFPHTL